MQPVEAGRSIQAAFPPVEGWSDEGLERARRYADSLHTTAVLALHEGRLVAEWGATDRRISGHSVRKSLVSALYGIAVEKGLIDIQRTLAELGIDDHNPPLSDQEKQARLVDLLTARSGIYHPSVQDDNAAPPERGAHAPGTFFYYNNWSFNAVGAIFERLAGLSLGEAFKQWVADPVGMQDFRVEDVRYQEGEESVFPAYRFWISARDLARFGVLYLQNGRWEGRQIVPESWISDSMARHSDLGNGVGYGYMWWIMPDSAFLATGTGGQKLIVDPARRLVVVNRVDTGEGLGRAVWFSFGPRVNNSQFLELTRRFAEAAPATHPEVP